MARVWNEIDYLEERETEEACLTVSLTYSAVGAAMAAKGGKKAIDAVMKRLRGE